MYVETGIAVLVEVIMEFEKKKQKNIKLRPGTTFIGPVKSDKETPKPPIPPEPPPPRFGP